MHMDCMEYMRSLPDKAFELAIVDPPYGIGVSVSMGRRKGMKHSGHHKFAGGDVAAPEPVYFDQLQRVSKNMIIWGANHFIDNIPFNVSSSCWLMWDKQQEFSGATFEMAWTSFQSPAKAFRMARCEAYVGINKIHPTQKPVKLYQWLLKNYAKPGDKILDTHLGSGSSAIAAHYAGFEFVGMELDPDYYAAAVKRFQQETAQQALNI